MMCGSMPPKGAPPHHAMWDPPTRRHTSQCYALACPPLFPCATPQDYEAALRVFPGSTEALHRKGQVLQALKRPQEAAHVWAQALAAAQPSADAAALLEMHASMLDPSRCFACGAVPNSAAASPSPVVAAASATAAACAAWPSTPTPPAGDGGRGGSGGGTGAVQRPALVPPEGAGSAERHAVACSAPADADTDGVEQLDCAAAQRWRGGGSGGGGGCGGGRGGGEPSLGPAAAAAVAAAGLPRQAALNPTIAVQLAVAQINGGKVLEAEQLLDQVRCERVEV
eukprot:259502-Chlamydomonas_euryale.AAC.1